MSGRPPHPTGRRRRYHLPLLLQPASLTTCRESKRKKEKGRRQHGPVPTLLPAVSLSLSLSPGPASASPHARNSSSQADPLTDSLRAAPPRTRPPPIG